VRYWIIAGLISSALLMSCTGLQPKPEPCNCDVAEKELRAYMLHYLDAIEDVGNLGQQLKACQERR
jgi:hypothetical protein